MLRYYQQRHNEIVGKTTAYAGPSTYATVVPNTIHSLPATETEEASTLYEIWNQSGATHFIRHFTPSNRVFVYINKFIQDNVLYENIPEDYWNVTKYQHLHIIVYDEVCRFFPGNDYYGHLAGIPGREGAYSGQAVAFECKPYLDLCNKTMIRPVYIQYQFEYDHPMPVQITLDIDDEVIDFYAETHSTLSGKCLPILITKKYFIDVAACTAPLDHTSTTTIIDQIDMHNKYYYKRTEIPSEIEANWARIGSYFLHMRNQPNSLPSLPTHIPNIAILDMNIVNMTNP
jgi:hypothetical protein